MYSYDIFHETKMCSLSITFNRIRHMIHPSLTKIKSSKQLIYDHIHLN